MFHSEGGRLSNDLFGQGYAKERLKSLLRKLYGRYEDLTKQYDVPPLPNVTCYFEGWPYTVIIVWRCHWTLATGAACQQSPFIPPDTWSCPTLRLAFVLMSRQISPELVLFPDFWVSNIPWYFCFALSSWGCIIEVRAWSIITKIISGY